MLTLEEFLSKNQKKLDVDKDGDIEKDDLKDLRDKKKDDPDDEDEDEDDKKKNEEEKPKFNFDKKKDDDKESDDDDEKDDDSDDDKKEKPKFNFDKKKDEDKKLKTEEEKPKFNFQKKKDDDEKESDKDDDSKDSDDEKSDGKKSEINFEKNGPESDENKPVKKLKESRAIEIVNKWKLNLNSLSEASMTYTNGDWFRVLENLGWKKSSNVDHMTKNFSGILPKGEINPEGKAIVDIQVRNNKLVATFKNSTIGMMDPRYNDPSKNAKKFDSDILKALKAKTK